MKIYKIYKKGVCKHSSYILVVVKEWNIAAVKKWNIAEPDYSHAYPRKTKKFTYILASFSSDPNLVISVCIFILGLVLYK